MKEQTLIQMKNQLAQQGAIIQQMWGHLQQLQQRQFQIGAVQEELPGYEDAVKAFADKVTEARQDAQNTQSEEVSNGADATSGGSTPKQEETEAQETQAQGTLLTDD